VKTAATLSPTTVLIFSRFAMAISVCREKKGACADLAANHNGALSPRPNSRAGVRRGDREKPELVTDSPISHLVTVPALTPNSSTAAFWKGRKTCGVARALAPRLGLA
jgi:hypothetical protein